MVTGPIMSLYPSSKVAAPRVGFTEFEILKASHKFLRDENPEDQGKANNKSWNEQLAEKYYENLYREFAVCDLKHYKSGNFALRWRTEDEVLSGAGETTCANTRCGHHHATASTAYNMSSSQAAEQSRSKVPLTTLELPFAYEEHGEHKSALVKVVLCDRCVQKLMYKRNKEKKQVMKAERAHEPTSQADGNEDGKGDRGVTKEERQAASRLPAEDEVGMEREGKITDPSQREKKRRKRHREEDYHRDDQCHETDGRHRHKHCKRSRSPRH